MHHRFHCHHADPRGLRGHGPIARGSREDIRGQSRGRPSSADLQLVLLGLLADKPLHGYEAMQELAESFKGFYTPSPESIYPALTYLEEIGRAMVTVEGARKRYEITDAGRQHLEENRAAVDELRRQWERSGERMDRFRRAMDLLQGGESARSSLVSNESRESWLARRALESALRAKRAESAEEQQRVIGILQRATEEILGKTGN